MVTTQQTDDERVAVLRGAGVGAVDVRRLVRVALAVVLVAAVVTAAVLFVAGARKNSQITALQQRGVPVGITVSGCLGLLGGSGSNAAGYTCRGSYTLRGRRYDAVITGTTLYTPGTIVRAVAVPDEPGLVVPATQLATEQPSGRVFIFPSVLLALVAAVCVGVLAARRSRREPVKEAVATA